jgi:hypothetical protein
MRRKLEELGGECTPYEGSSAGTGTIFLAIRALFSGPLHGLATLGRLERSLRAHKFVKNMGVETW